MKQKACPTCGHPVPTDTLPGLRMSPLKARIFLIVSACTPAGIPCASLAERIYAGNIDGGPDDAEGTIRQHINQLNKILKPLYLCIEGRNGSAAGGYRLLKLPREHAVEQPNLSKDQGDGENCQSNVRRLHRAGV